jgi:hypothetical protein
MNLDAPTPDHDANRDIKDRPSRARYDKVKHGLDLKWRRRTPQPERMMREIVDGLWDAFGDSPWSWCGMWLPQPDGKAFQPGAARPEPAGAPAPATGLLGEVYASGEPRSSGGEIAVAVLDKNGRPWFVFQAKSAAPFDEMDARWIERMFKAFQTIERPEPPLP